MALTDMVIMPGADYEDACNAVREKTGGTEVIKSGEMGAQIRAIETGGSVETVDVSLKLTEGPGWEIVYTYVTLDGTIVNRVFDPVAVLPEGDPLAHFWRDGYYICGNFNALKGSIITIGSTENWTITFSNEVNCSWYPVTASRFAAAIYDITDGASITAELL